MNFLRVTRLDDSDTRVYESAAHPGEWAVCGTSAFFAVDVGDLMGKAHQAFRHGFLGIGSFGWTTLVHVDEITPVEYLRVIDKLANYLAAHGAPTAEAARAAAQEEVEYTASLCTHPRHTLMALERTLEGEEIVESFRVVPRPDGLDHGRVKLWGPAED
ncbi:MAG: hypothetical protein JSW09_09590 [Pseudomonadota bacterium]|nr:MAG: hypothetical protein JSW09_09590 [Pseudomonadota bacterium]